MQNCILVTTSTSLVFRLNFTSHSGRSVISETPLTRSSGMFGRSSSVIFSAGEDKDGIAGVAIRNETVWIMAGRMAQKWHFSQTGQKVSATSIRSQVNRLTSSTCKRWICMSWRGGRYTARGGLRKGWTCVQWT